MRLLTVNVVTGDELQHLINQDDGEGELQHHEPLVYAQVGQLEDHLRCDRVGERRLRIHSGELPHKFVTEAREVYI